MTPWKDPETGEYVTIGRCNIGAVSLNLPLMWEIARYEHPEATEEHFFKILDEKMELTKRFLLRRYEAIENTLCSTNPLCFTQGGLYKGHKNPNDKIGDLTQYMTASFGYIGLHDLTLAAKGCTLYDDHSEFAHKVLKHIQSNIDKFKKEHHRLFALYGTPAESYCGVAVEQTRAYLESIGEKERAFKLPEFYTNSFHQLNGGANQ